MNGFPQRLKHGSGGIVLLDESRLLLGFREAPQRQEVAERLKEVGLVLEDGARYENGSGIANRARVNHTPTRLWVRAAHGGEIEDRTLGALRELFSDALAWIGPVYRMPNMPGRSGLLCPLPHTLLVRLAREVGDAPDVVRRVAMAGAAGRSANGSPALAAEPKIREVEEKSRYLGPFHYYEIDNAIEVNAYEIRAALEKAGRDEVLDVRFESMPLLVPTAVVPNDTLFAQQWDMAQIDAPQGWDITTGSNSVVVCVLDEGCDLTHPDLQYFGTGINLGTMSGDGSPTGNHGTACAGIVAGRFNNSAGVAGVAGDCLIMPLAFQAWSDVEVAAGINFAADNGAHVISMSFGWNAWDPAIIDPAIQHAFDEDLVMAVATHNHDGAITYPATNALVMAVGASDQADGRKNPSSPDGECWGSNFGPQISVVAPGVIIPTTDIQGADGYNADGSAQVWACVNYGSGGDAAGDYVTIFDGTSAATPHVAGLAGLLRSQYPTLSNAEIRRIIERTAEKTGTVAYAETAGYPSGTWNQEMGYGRINVFRALDYADLLIRDWTGDDGAEPSSSGNFWSFSDIVVRIFDDDVFVPGDPTQSKHLELGQTNYLYIRVRNNGPQAARNVNVSARLTPFVGTQFVYPHDWTAVDGAHLSPTPIAATFASIAAGDEVIAKFSISAAQVQTLFDESWHPCLVASVTADNDYGFDTAAFTGDPVVVQRNNLAQRNLSVINVLADAGAAATVAFPFVAGHRLDEGRTLTLVVDRSRLPQAMPVRLALDEGNRFFPQVDLETGPVLTDADGCSDGIEFLDKTRIRTRIGCCDGVLTLAKGSRLDCPPRYRPGNVVVRGGELVVRDGKRYVEVREKQALIQIEKAAGQMLPLEIQSAVPAGTAAGTQMMVDVAQRNEAGRTVGGASVMWLAE